jgi:hypothetical protein
VTTVVDGGDGSITTVVFFPPEVVTINTDGTSEEGTIVGSTDGTVVGTLGGLTVIIVD